MNLSESKEDIQQSATTQPSQQPLPVKPVPSVRMSKLLTGIALVVVILLVGIIYVIDTRVSIHTVAHYAARPTLAIPTLDPTANWATYTEKSVGFTLKYPNNWTVTEEKTPVSSQFPDGISGVTIGGVEGSVNVRWDGGGEVPCSSEDLKTNLGGIMEQACKKVTDTNGDVSWVFYHGVSPLFFTITATASACRSSDCRQLSAVQKQQNLKITQQVIFNILSRLVFFGVPQMETPQWQTYTNTTYHYSLRYPTSGINEAAYIINSRKCQNGDAGVGGNKVFAYRNSAYIVPVSYMENLGGVCKIIPTTIDRILSKLPSDFVPTVTIIPAVSDSQITDFIRSTFGTNCSLGTKTLSTKGDWFDIKVAGPYTCNPSAQVRWYPSKNELVYITAATGDNCTFDSGVNGLCQADIDFMNSFSFTN